MYMYVYARFPTCWCSEVYVDMPLSPTGFRLYPHKPLPDMKLETSLTEADKSDRDLLTILLADIAYALALTSNNIDLTTSNGCHIHPSPSARFIY